jgi:hypothetical protein
VAGGALVKFDPVLGRIPESRIGGAGLERWGSKPAPPVAGVEWFEQFPYEAARLSNGIETERQWYALHFTSVLVRGFCDLGTVRATLAEEGLVPVGACRDGKSTPEAMATLWFNRIHDSVCGTYHEIVASFDVASKGEPIAFRAKGPGTWELQYANFGPSVCEGQFLHSLWIDSPLSIMWGREMQGFPKHPKPVVSRLADGEDRFQFDLSWDGSNVMRGRIEKRADILWQVGALMRAHGPLAVGRFAVAPSFDIPIVMPRKTAEQNRVGRRYIAHLWKGLAPTAVQVWAWGSKDSLDLGSIGVPTGCEEHNGHTLLSRAGFAPVSVTYLPRAAAIVEARA